VEKDFPDDVVQSLGKGFGTWALQHDVNTIGLSGDVRLTSPHLKKQFAAGVNSTGVDVIDLGILPTPVNYFSLYQLPIDGAVQITGSHNPPAYNGFKMSLKSGSVYGEQIQAIRQIIESGEFAEGSGQISRQEILDKYIETIVEKITLEKPLKVAIDCGNASAALAAPEIFRRLKVGATELYCDVDGSFPNHHPDPTVLKNVQDLIDTVRDGDYDVGIAYDGDGDRVGVVDDTGHVVWADYLMTIFLDEVIHNPGDEVIFDVKCSQALEQAIREKGGTPVMWKTGHSLIKQKMKDSTARFAGEMSGHIFFADDYYGYDDAIYASVRVLQTLSRTDRKLSELLAELPHFESTPEMRLEAADDAEKFKIAERAKEYFSQKYEYIDVDGIRIKFGDGWGLVRSSNTQPVIVCRFEAKSKERLQEIRDLVINKLQEFGDLKVGE